MPTCCAPGCLNNNDDPILSFFRLPWKNCILVDQWLAKLPGKEARVCRQHFEDKCVVLDAKYKLPPNFTQMQLQNLQQMLYQLSSNIDLLRRLGMPVKTGQRNVN